MIRRLFNSILAICMGISATSSIGGSNGAHLPFLKRTKTCCNLNEMEGQATLIELSEVPQYGKHCSSGADIENQYRSFQQDLLYQACEELKQMRTIRYEEQVPLLVNQMFKAFNQGITLLDAKVDPNCADFRGCSLLHYAVMHKSYVIVEQLLKQKASVCVKNVSGNTPLHTACAVGVKGIVSKLIKAGAELNAQNDEGKTPLHVAVEHDHWGVVGLLLSKDGINLEIADAAGQTPLYSAIRRYHVHNAVALIKRGADIEHRDIFGKKALEGASSFAHLTGRKNFVEALNYVLYPADNVVYFH